MPLNQISSKIRNRVNANDVLYTPLPTALKLIEITDIHENDKVLDPSRGKGVFYDNIPVENKDWCEITDGVDFFDYNKPVDIIIGNPPFSILKKWLSKSIELNPKKIAYVMGAINLNHNRMKLLYDNNYFITKLVITDVRDWFGPTHLVVFEKNATPVVDYMLGLRKKDLIKTI